MTRIRGKKIQVWGSIDEDVYAEIEKMAAKEHRKETQMVAILIEYAVKERKRSRKKNAKEDQV